MIKEGCKRHIHYSFTYSCECKHAAWHRGNWEHALIHIKCSPSSPQWQGLYHKSCARRKSLNICTINGSPYYTMVLQSSSLVLLASQRVRCLGGLTHQVEQEGVGVENQSVAGLRQVACNFF